MDKIMPNLPIIGKNGKTPDNIDQAKKNQMKHIEEISKKFIKFAIENEFTADEFMMSCDVIMKKLNNNFQEKVNLLKADYGKSSIQETLLENK